LENNFNIETIFLNIDIDICSTKGMSDFLCHIEHNILILNKSKLAASFELNENIQSVEEGIRRLVELIEKLPDPVREFWDKFDYRKINIGFQSGRGPHEAHFNISKEAVSSISRIGGEILVTIYGSS
jgi:hypothetical protein